MNRSLKEQLQALRSFSQDFVTDKKGWGTGLPCVSWLRANLFWDIWGGLRDYIKLFMGCLKRIGEKCETYYEMFRERTKVMKGGTKMDVEGPSMSKWRGGVDNRGQLCINKLLVVSLSGQALQLITAICLVFFLNTLRNYFSGWGCSPFCFSMCVRHQGTTSQNQVRGLGGS